ncbi:MAG: YeeE/YedE family protein [Schleiferiaceae bacterium]|nr:YeeE/YedE family protein [Schleiferiaceae bacterium]
MKLIKYAITGILFGIVMTKSEAISWFRIQEMFRFQSFHMYGIIITAIVIGVITTQLIKRFKIRDIGGNPIIFNPKDMSIWRYLAGGTIFGLGWAMTGACPGPMFVNFGYGYSMMILIIIGALLGTLLYGILRTKLPH